MGGPQTNDESSDVGAAQTLDVGGPDPSVMERQPHPLSKHQGTGSEMGSGIELLRGCAPHQRTGPPSAPTLADDSQSEVGVRQ